MTLTNENQELVVIANNLENQFKTTTSFTNPEILAIDNENLLSFFPDTLGLEKYRQYLDDMLRYKPHTLGTETELILADMKMVGDSAKNIFEMLQNADIKFGSITDDDGNQIEVTQGLYHTFMESDNRQVRKDAYNTFYDSWWRLKNTLATAYSNFVKKNVIFARTRKYDSALNEALFQYNIPRSVYDNLITSTNKYLPTLHHYMALRKDALSLKNLHIYDMSVPLVDKLDITISYEEAKAKIIEGLRPLGQDYSEIMQQCINGWIDVFENTGKRKGAYS